MESIIRISIMQPGKIFSPCQIMPMTMARPNQDHRIRAVAAGLTGRQTGNEFRFRTRSRIQPQIL